VRADREALTDHHPRSEAALAEEVLAAAADAIADDQPDRRDDDEIGDEDRPVERRDRHAVTATTRSSHASASQSAVSVPHVVVPRYAAGLVDAIADAASIGRPVKRTVFATARSSVRLEPARYGVPGSDTRPSADSSPSTSPIR